MFEQNKYHTWYSNIIQNAQRAGRQKLPRTHSDWQYYERHHILPQSLFPDNRDDADNLVLLTPKEHFICHLLLTRFTTGAARAKMLNAVVKMQWSAGEGQKRYTSRHFDMVRRMVADKNSILFLGRTFTEEHRAALSASHTGKTMSQECRDKRTQINKELWERGHFDNRPAHSDDTKQKIREARAKQVITPESRAKAADTRRRNAKPVSAETRAKISEKAKNRPKRKLSAETIAKRTATAKANREAKRLASSCAPAGE